VGVLLQGFFKMRPNRAVPSPADGDSTVPWWWDQLAAQANDFCDAGFTALWLPPVLKSASGADAGADGYGAFDAAAAANLPSRPRSPTSLSRQRQISVRLIPSPKHKRGPPCAPTCFCNVLTDEQRQDIAKKHDATGKQLTRYIEELIAHRWLTVKLGGFGHLLRRLWAKATGSKSLTDDIVARMLRSHFPGEVNYDLKRLGVNAGGLLIGAIETTSQAVAQVLEYLIENGEWFSRAQAAARLADTSAFDGIVWEALRFVPIAPLLFRQSAVDYTIGRGSSYETKVAAGTYVLALTQSAMFDQRAFEDPLRFIPSRNWYHYFHFGFGSHECLGRYIGMVMIPEMVRQLMLRPGLKGHGRIDYRGGPFPERYDLSWGATEP
jgi:hypothetical protein